AAGRVANVLWVLRADVCRPRVRTRRRTAGRTWRVDAERRHAVRCRGDCDARRARAGHRVKRRGVWIRACAAAIFDAWTMEHVVDPAIADLRHETASASRYFAILKVVAICLWAGGAAMRCSFCRRPDSQVEKLVAGPWRLL